MERHATTLNRLSHTHDFDMDNRDNEQRTLWVGILTVATMIAEISVGIMTGSMALLADGWHMGTHTFALGIGYSAYVLARKYRQSDKFSFGTGKFGVLAGYTSAIILGLAGGWMIAESVERLFNPVKINFFTAILVTVIGLLVNLVSVAILHNKDHDHEHDHNDHDHDHEHHDHNYQAVYYHVIADALTSILALGALLAGQHIGWIWLDPLAGIVGGVMIGRWAWGLLRSTGMILLDGNAGHEMNDRIRELIENDGDSRIADLHLWQIGSNNCAAILSIVSGTGRMAAEYRSRLREELPEVKHLSIEVTLCQECAGKRAD